MEKFKGKPGPWHWEGKVLCNDAHIVGGDGWAFNDADKRLIAAAPELLETLKLILSYHDDGNCVLHKEDVSMARSAIKKALGEKTMKLIDLLVKELPKRGGWPEAAVCATQDKDGEVCFSKGATPVFGSDAWHDGDWFGNEFITITASDYDTAIITRAQYEAALAASKAVVGHNGWIQWAGGECPVDSDAIVEVRYRSPNPYQYSNDRAGDFDWEHIGSNADIIAYRLHDQSIKSRANDDQLEQDLNECIGQDVDVPEWNGDGLPPVGTICMANLANGWTDVKVAYIGDEGGCREALVFEIKTTNPAWADEFRPLRTEAERKRDAFINAVLDDMRTIPCDLSLRDEVAVIYDAIAAGKIPGVKLEGK